MPKLSPDELKKIKLIICTPCYGGLCSCHYTTSLLQTIALFQSNGIKIDVKFIDYESLIPRGRNTLVAKFMADETNTHLLFIDADIRWNPIDVYKLIAHDKDLAGGLYPQKAYNWDKLSSVNDKTDVCKLLKYNINTVASQMIIKDNLIEAKYIATGFMMIKRKVLQKMIDTFPELKYKDDIKCCNGNKKEESYLYALFDCKIVEGRYLSEDYLFCDYWRKLGGQIFVDVTINLTHIGSHYFEGNLLKTYKTSKITNPEIQSTNPITESVNKQSVDYNLDGDPHVIT